MNNSKKLSLFKDKPSNTCGFTDIRVKRDALLDSVSQFDSPSIKTRSVSGISDRQKETEIDTDGLVDTDYGWITASDIGAVDCAPDVYASTRSRYPSCR